MLRLLGIMTLVLIATGVSAQPEFADKTWYMTSMNAVPVELDKFPDRKPEIRFMDEDRFSAWVGCNQIMGTYKLVDKELSFLQPASTLMMCDGKMEFEQDFIKMLENVSYWEMQGDGHTLSFLSSEYQILAVYDDVPSYP